MTAYYNENDPYVAEWLRNLIAAGHIASGVVDRRPIQDVEAFELMQFTQCHFFAGIGVWSHALRRAGWSDDRPIWTGSCPCQPFSGAGKKKGFEDERHLWPTWFRLIAQCKPSIVVGEQVDKAFDWIDLVSSDLETQNYAFGASIISAAGFEGAHIRHRNYFVGLAYSTSCGCSGPCGCGEKQGQRITERSLLGGLGDPGVQSGERRTRSVSGTETGSTSARYPDGRHDHGHSDAGKVDRLADDQTKRCEGQSIRSDGEQTLGIEEASNASGPTNTPLLGRTPVDWLFSRDGKWRPVEPSTFPLAHATPARVGRLRAYGNTLDAETATQFCEVVREICDGV